MIINIVYKIIIITWSTNHNINQFGPLECILGEDKIVLMIAMHPSTLILQHLSEIIHPHELVGLSIHLEPFGSKEE